MEQNVNRGWSSSLMWRVGVVDFGVSHRDCVSKASLGIWNGVRAAASKARRQEGDNPIDFGGVLHRLKEYKNIVAHYWSSGSDG